MISLALDAAHDLSLDSQGNIALLKDNIKVTSQNIATRCQLIMEESNDAPDQGLNLNNLLGKDANDNTRRTELLRVIEEDENVVRVDSLDITYDKSTRQGKYTAYILVQDPDTLETEQIVLEG